MKKTNEIDLKEINKQQKDVIKRVNLMIIEYQEVFSEQPEELVISKYDFNILSNNEPQDYMVLGKIKLYSVR